MRMGGAPFTGVKNWLLENKCKGRESAGSLVMVNGENIRQDVFVKAVTEVESAYPDFLFSNHWLENPVKLVGFRYLGKKIQLAFIKKNLNSLIGLKKFGKYPHISFCVIEIGGFKIAIFKKNKLVGARKFVEIMSCFQNYYNLILAGISRPEILRETKKKIIFAPLHEYPSFYGCVFSSLAEKISQDNKSYIYKSLIPSAFLAGLPNYCVYTKNGIRRVNHSNDNLTGRDGLKALGIKYQFLNFSNKKSALGYLSSHKKKNRALILAGNIAYLHFLYSYKNFDFLKEYDFISLDTFELFCGKFSKNYFIYSPNNHFFGRIPAEDFIRFWENRNINKKFSVKPLEKDLRLRHFTIFDLKNLQNLDFSKTSQLLVFLSACVEEFYKNRIIKTKGYGMGKKTVYLGQNALKKYQADIVGNLRKDEGCISDIMIFYVAKQFERTFLFLGDLLNDFASAGNKFVEDQKTIKDLTGRLNVIIDITEKEALASRIFYVKGTFSPTIIPKSKLLKRKYLSDTAKKEIFKNVKKAVSLQNKLFFSIKMKI